ncbi:hypothetical protein E2562_018486 [Oryza meyeriana var. granulata]|uniref:Uncharacterized protein n=1 Tax=Oryza meyeriana var. granulata TaxID=110450 RepID=A0A6G1EMJ7_9ORYZ|nr:hypothetical protein E2562_018486 [Oryza meyeriana var. granulata]
MNRRRKREPSEGPRIIAYEAGFSCDLTEYEICAFTSSRLLNLTWPQCRTCMRQQQQHWANPSPSNPNLGRPHHPAQLPVWPMAKLGLAGCPCPHRPWAFGSPTRPANRAGGLA